MQRSTTISISLKVILKGRAHKAYEQHPDEIIDELRQALTGGSESTLDGSIAIKNLQIKPLPQ